MNHCRHRFVSSIATAAAVLLVVAQETAYAQSAAAVGLADNYTARARGQDAIIWNPANLALPDGPAFSVTLLPFRAFAGTTPIDVFDLADAESGSLTEAQKRRWLDRIAATGTEYGMLGADIAGVSLSWGRVGFMLSSSASGALTLGSDAAELLLYGPRGANGEPRDFDVEGSSFHAAVTSSVALSYARSVPLRIDAAPFPDQHASIGVTVRYITGHALFAAFGLGEAASDDLHSDLPLPLIYSDAADGFDHGAGAAVDLGVAWLAGPLTLGVVLRDALNTFEWDLASLRYRSAAGLLADDEDDPRSGPMSSAPHAVQVMARRRLGRLAYPPVLAVGGSLDLPELSLTLDLRHRFGEGLDLEPATHAGIGAEYRRLPYLPLRAGLAAVSGGYRAAAGVGVERGPIAFAIAAARIRGNLGSYTCLTASFTVLGRPASPRVPHENGRPAS